MQHKDFSLHRLAKAHGIPEIFHVGWLDDKKDFKTGELPDGFTKKLNLLLEHPVKCPSAGHNCKLCAGTGSFRQATEYWLKDAKGKIYVAPSMIHHYINSHQYKPPQTYIDAVMKLGSFWKRSVVMTKQDVANFISPFAGRKKSSVQG